MVAGFLAAVAAEGGGQAAGVRHPVLKHEFDPARAAEYEKAVERVMSLPEEAMPLVTRFCMWALATVSTQFASAHLRGT